MTCARCGKKFDAAERPVCPQCGAVYRAVKSGVMKSSTILISVGETDAVFRSVKEVPPPLRRKLLKSTNGVNVATILIADRRGREEIARAIQNLPSSMQRRLLQPYREESGGVRAWLSRPIVRMATALVLAAGSFGVIWFVFSHAWR